MALERARDIEVEPTLYFPKINRVLVEKLEHQLRQSVLVQNTVVETVVERPISDADSSDLGATPLLTDAKLHEALRLLNDAAASTAELRNFAMTRKERAEVFQSLYSLQGRVVGYEQEFESVVQALKAARREADELRRRSQAAEGKLVRLLAMLEKVISPLWQGAMKSNLPQVTESFGTAATNKGQA